jgi:hypothetical protein
LVLVVRLELRKIREQLVLIVLSLEQVYQPSLHLVVVQVAEHHLATVRRVATVVRVVVAVLAALRVLAQVQQIKVLVVAQV